MNMIFNKNVRLLICCLGLLFVFSSCATDLATRATRVRLVTAEKAKEMEDQCEFIGNVVGRSDWIFSAKVAHHNALAELLDNAAEIGATHLFVNRGSFRQLMGEAFYCARCVDKNDNPDVDRCEDKSGNPVAIDSKVKCEAEGNLWVLGPANQIVCEAKGGYWVINKDVLRKPETQPGEEKK